jgi:hypothetical protein
MGSTQSLLFTVYGGGGILSSGEKWPGRQADHSALFYTEVKNLGAIPQLPMF